MTIWKGKRKRQDCGRGSVCQVGHRIGGPRWRCRKRMGANNKQNDGRSTACIPAPLHRLNVRTAVCDLPRVGGGRLDACSLHSDQHTKSNQDLTCRLACENGARTGHGSCEQDYRSARRKSHASLLGMSMMERSDRPAIAVRWCNLVVCQRPIWMRTQLTFNTPFDRMTEPHGCRRSEKIRCSIARGKRARTVFSYTL